MIFFVVIFSASKVFNSFSISTRRRLAAADIASASLNNALYWTETVAFVFTGRGVLPDGKGSKNLKSYIETELNSAITAYANINNRQKASIKQQEQQWEKREQRQRDKRRKKKH